MSKIVEEFEDYKIQEGSIQFEGEETAVGFGCIGTV